MNTVNCVGVMGRGIALQFKQAFRASGVEMGDADAELPDYLPMVLEFGALTDRGLTVATAESLTGGLLAAYLLSPEQQQKALAYGLRPANSDVPVDATADSLFVKWKDQGVQTVVPRTSAMRSPDRDVLLALLRWFELNVGK